MSPSLLDFLRHISSECDYILRVTANVTQSEFFNDETLSRAIVRSLEVIGEATKKVPSDLKIKYPQVSWSEMAGMRDVLIHDYFGIDYDVVWNTVIKEIPELHSELEKIIVAET
jgi:uncharacterized protein with HEPN domain